MIRIVTDSVSDIPKEYVEKYNIEVMPLKIRIDEDEYEDGVQITTEKMFEKIQGQDLFPSTSQITPFEFASKFDELTRNGDEVLAVVMSSDMSGTYNSALAAKLELEDRKIEVVDSQSITLGFGMLVIEAARLAMENRGLEEIKSSIEEMKHKMDSTIVFDTLEYAYKGGRISKAQYMLANFFNLKILITMENGEMVVRNKVRGRKKAIKAIIENLESTNQNLDGKTIGINHANDEKYLEELKRAILQKYQPKEIIVSKVGCAVAAYSGLSAVALHFEREA